MIRCLKKLKIMKNKKQEYIDDGHTIYSMDVDAKWARPKEKQQSVYVSKEEKRILIKAAFRAYIPKLLIVLFGFGLAIILIYFWLM